MKVRRLRIRVACATLWKIELEQWSIPVAVQACPLREEGSRFAGLNERRAQDPCRESHREQDHCSTREKVSREPLLARANLVDFGRLLFERLRGVNRDEYRNFQLDRIAKVRYS